MAKKIAIGIVLLVVLGGAISFYWAGGTSRRVKSNTPSKGFVKEGEVTFLDSVGNALIKIDVEIASRPEERTKGMMYRDNMPARFGMLFMFEQMGQRSFWMRNCPLPLDLIFLDDGKKIVSIQPNAKPYSDDPIPSGVPAMYVIEVNAGFCDLHGVQVGQVTQF